MNVYKAGFAKKNQNLIFLYIKPCYESQKKNVDMSRKLFFNLKLFLFVYVYYIQFFQWMY